MSCWAEVSKTTIKDFRENVTGRHSDNSILAETSDTKVFLIRYMPKPPFDNSMFVDFNGLEYKIEKMEVDYANKEMIMISGVRIT